MIFLHHPCKNIHCLFVHQLDRTLFFKSVSTAHPFHIISPVSDISGFSSNLKNRLKIIYSYNPAWLTLNAQRKTVHLLELSDPSHRSPVLDRSHQPGNSLMPFDDSDDLFFAVTFFVSRATARIILTVGQPYKGKKPPNTNYMVGLQANLKLRSRSL